MTLNVKEFVPTNLQDVELYVEMLDNIQFILGKKEIKLATTYDNAIAGTYIDITDTGIGVHTLRCTLSAQSSVFTVDSSTDVSTLTDFIDITNGATVQLTTTDTLPAGLSAETNYYVIKTTAIAEFNDVKNKYRDFLSLDDEIVKKIITELGYDYIVDVLNLTDDQTKIFLGYVSILHFLKGHRRGLEMVFEMLHISAESIIEWWQILADPTLVNVFGVTNDVTFLTNSSFYTVSYEPDTFYLKISANTDHLQTDILTTLVLMKGFIREYVYPLLVKIDFSDYTLEIWDGVKNTDREATLSRDDHDYYCPAQMPDETFFTNNKLDTTFQRFNVAAVYLYPSYTNGGAWSRTQQTVQVCTQAPDYLDFNYDNI